MIALGSREGKNMIAASAVDFVVRVRPQASAHAISLNVTTAVRRVSDCNAGCTPCRTVMQIKTQPAFPTTGYAFDRALWTRIVSHGQASFKPCTATCIAECVRVGAR